MLEIIIILVKQKWKIISKYLFYVYLRYYFNKILTQVG